MTEQLQTEIQDAAGIDPYGSYFLPSRRADKVKAKQTFEGQVLALSLGRRPYEGVITPQEQLAIYERLCAERDSCLGVDAVSMAFGEIL